MNKIKAFIMSIVISSLYISLAWAGNVEVVEVDEERNALVALSLCGEGILIDNPQKVSEDETLYILFSATETGDIDCVTTEESIAIPVCNAYSKIVALLHSEITPVPEGDIYKDLTVDSLDVELGVNIEGCCLEEWEACDAACDEGDTGCSAICDEEKATCLESSVDPEITVDCDPDTLNLKSNGNFLTCYLSSTYEEGVENIDQTNLYLHYSYDTTTIDLLSLFSAIEEDRLMVKFSRQELIQAIGEVEVPMEIELIVSGDQVVGDSFEAADTINVIKPPHFDTALSGQTAKLTVTDFDPSAVSSATIFWGDRGRTVVSAEELAAGVSHAYTYPRKQGYKIRVQIVDNEGIKANYSYDNNSNLEVSVSLPEPI